MYLCVCVAIQLLHLLQRVNCAIFLLQYISNQRLRPSIARLFLSSSFAHVHMHT